MNCPTAEREFFSDFKTSFPLFTNESVFHLRCDLNAAVKLLFFFSKKKICAHAHKCRFPNISRLGLQVSGGIQEITESHSVCLWDATWNPGCPLELAASPLQSRPSLYLFVTLYLSVSSPPLHLNPLLSFSAFFSSASCPCSSFY